MSPRSLGIALGLQFLPLLACSVSSDDENVLDQSPEADSVSMSGPANSAGSSAEVWSVNAAWSDKAPSGHTWEEEFSVWVGSFKKIPGDTIEIPSPYGARKLPGPALECAEVAMTLRITFASWHHLPFLLGAWDSKANKAMFASHLGFVYADGTAVKGFPLFRAQYKDFEKTWHEGQAWPSDAQLRKLHLASDDTNSFLSDQGGAGSYFDELFLNKRVGYFARLTLLWFGSINLADPSNLFQIKPEATTAGDVLLERWQKKGIGHTIPVIHVEHTGGDHLAIDVASGSMPRRQPLWDGPDQSTWSFTNDMTGGMGSASDGTPYAKLGGGIHRWRTPVLRNGRWSNEVPTVDKIVYINSTSVDAIAARPARFGELLAQGTPEEQRDAALTRIATARQHLLEHASSCSARTEREDAFQKLYDISQASFGMDKAAVDKKWRTLEDHVFGELVYDKSKTCCWDSTTTKMTDLILAYAKDEQAKAAQKGMCVQPTVFAAKGTGDGFDTWRTYATQSGKASDWKAWSEDEPCAQRAVKEDTTSRTATYCAP
jgi:hypothetical protein